MDARLFAFTLFAFAAVTSTQRGNACKVPSFSESRSVNSWLSVLEKLQNITSDEIGAIVVRKERLSKELLDSDTETLSLITQIRQNEKLKRNWIDKLTVLKAIIRHVSRKERTVGTKVSKLKRSIFAACGPKSNRECVFPWKYGEQTFSGCANPDDDKQGLWCSTKVDTSGKHLAGNYRYCNPDCYRLAACGPKSNRECVFPWKYGEKTFSGCANPDDDEQGLWCSTKVDASGKHLAGNYRYCNPDCHRLGSVNRRRQLKRELQSLSNFLSDVQRNISLTTQKEGCVIIEIKKVAYQIFLLKESTRKKEIELRQAKVEKTAALEELYNISDIKMRIELKLSTLPEAGDLIDDDDWREMNEQIESIITSLRARLCAPSIGRLRSGYHIRLSAPINGGFTSWTAWGECTRTCAGGEQWRWRTCTQPTPKNCGNNCEGRWREKQSCNAHRCPVNGGFTSWTAWGRCSRTCGGGKQWKTRTCTNPTPRYHGKSCAGTSRDVRTCNTHRCPVNGGWCSWGWYGSCSASCGGGTMHRYRTCRCPTPYKGTECRGSSSDSSSCNTRCCQHTCQNGKCIPHSYKCDGDNDCGDWSDETGSSAGWKCGNGKCIRRTYRCDADNDCGDWSDETTSYCSNTRSGCSRSSKCNVNEGDCDWDFQCKGSFTCGNDNCPWPGNDDCCEI